MKKTFMMVGMLLCMFVVAACVQDDKDISNKVEDEVVSVVHEIDADNIRHVTISGNARSIVIKQSENKYFQIYSEDLNKDHIYNVRNVKNGDTLDIAVTMKNEEADNNNILGSVIIEIPQKQFEKIGVSGEFHQIFVYTLDSDILIQANNAFVNFDVEAEHFKHDITLAGSKPNGCKGASIYFDRIPDNIELDLTAIQTIKDPQNILKDGKLISGTKKHVISINDTTDVNLYYKE